MVFYLISVFFFFNPTFSCNVVVLNQWGEGVWGIDDAGASS